MTTTDKETHAALGQENLDWGPDSPRGGQVVMARILKENATVPLFFGQTMIQSLRDVGYNHTTSALCEHVDNSIQAGATQIRVYFRQTGSRGAYQMDAAVYDNTLRRFLEAVLTTSNMIVKVSRSIYTNIQPGQTRFNQFFRPFG